MAGQVPRRPSLLTQQWRTAGGFSSLNPEPRTLNPFLTSPISLLTYEPKRRRGRRTPNPPLAIPPTPGYPARRVLKATATWSVA